MKVWITTDTHWHQDGAKIERPEDHTGRQFRLWIAVVKPEDLVIHCGDVTWQARTLESELKVLPGRKILVRGNHDNESHSWYMRHGFDFACDSFVMKKVLFTHAPANQLPGNALLNVHGHLHGNGHRLESYNPQPWHRLLALERVKYTPVSFDKFVGNLGVIELA
jgi:calcineurin-like phosphoesterase family protein